MNKELQIGNLWAGSDHQTFYVTGLTNSAAENDIALTLAYRAAAPSTAAAASKPTRMTVVKIISEAESDFPTNKARHVFGPLEKLLIYGVPDVEVVWSVGDEFLQRGGALHFTVTNTAARFSLAATSMAASFSLPYRVITPSLECDVTSYGLPTYQAWNEHDTWKPLEGHPGVGLLTEIHLCPSYVSFTNVFVCESYAVATNVWGYFANTNLFPQGSLDHNRKAGALKDIRVGGDNYAGTDLAASVFQVREPPWIDGGFSWPITATWRTKDDLVTGPLAWSIQVFTLRSNGDMYVYKFGHMAVRGTNDVAHLVD